jgi:DNA adenine methylase
MNMETRIIARKRRAAGALRALFRYQGGKQDLCGPLVDRFPSGIRRYFEPFLGAGSVFLDLHSRGFRGPAFLSDGNPEIANAHQVVASDPDAFGRAYRVHVDGHCRDYFYWLRDQDASGWTSVERAARTVYLVKAAFHGLYRVNGEGRVVSTYGTGELHRVALEGGRIRAVSAAFRGADIRHGDFGWVEAMAEAGDLVFLDPPYVGGNVAYCAAGFGEEDQRRLRRLCDVLHARGAFFLQTNSDRPFVRELYRDFHLLAVPPATAIGRGDAGKQPVGEVVIMNFEPGAGAVGKVRVAA